MVQKERKTQLISVGNTWGVDEDPILCVSYVNKKISKKMETNNIINKVNLLFIQLLSHVQFFPISWTAVCQAP